MAKTTGFHRGQIEGILSELVESIQDLLSSGHSVTIEGLGTFQTALTSQGCVLPEQVTPGKLLFHAYILWQTQNSVGN